MGPGMAPEEQDPGLVSAAAARGAEGRVAVGQVRVGACGSSSAVVAELARDPEAARAVAAAARQALLGAQGVEAGPAGVAVPVEDLVVPAQPREALPAVAGPERAFLENG